MSLFNEVFSAGKIMVSQKGEREFSFLCKICEELLTKNVFTKQWKMWKEKFRLCPVIIKNKDNERFN